MNINAHCDSDFEVGRLAVNLHRVDTHVKSANLLSRCGHVTNCNI